MTRHRPPRHLEDYRFSTPLPPAAEDAAWAELAVPGALEARIEATRLEAAPAYCAACGSRTPDARQPKEKRCPRCKLVLPSYRFRRNRAQLDGLSVWCAVCGAQDAKLRRTRHALRVLGRSA